VVKIDICATFHELMGTVNNSDYDAENDTAVACASWQWPNYYCCLCAM